eukprot:TRINITY_DN3453_c0_g1_i2.p1 TRINITY_DN3453_c0_g1~~TRINITY_DN3453_c0_g1_i2.p1  ORF type:complete len:164 (-),score=18.15 TRINITY_DN3453_c0_g1_i2:100-591(-)
MAVVSSESASNQHLEIDNMFVIVFVPSKSQSIRISVCSILHLIIAPLSFELGPIRPCVHTLPVSLVFEPLSLVASLLVDATFHKVPNHFSTSMCCVFEPFAMINPFSLWPDVYAIPMSLVISPISTIDTSVCPHLDSSATDFVAIKLTSVLTIPSNQTKKKIL